MAIVHDNDLHLVENMVCHSILVYCVALVAASYLPEYQKDAVHKPPEVNPHHLEHVYNIHAPDDEG